MTIAYNLGIPAANNNPSTDQPNMLTNNDNIATYVAVDHVAFNTAGSGQHNQVTFHANNTPSIPTSPPVLFTANDAATTPQLFFYSGNTLKTSGQYVAASSGSTYALGGIIIKWGTGVCNNPDVTNNFASAFPNNCFSVVVTSTDAAYTGTIVARNFTTSNFTARRQNGVGVTGFTYVAIGN